MSLPRTRWFDRTFGFDLPVTQYPDLLERLRGTPARLEERVSGLSRDLLSRRAGEAWSIQENVGHLLDLEPLWLSRAQEFLKGAETLSAADQENRATHQANHNARDIRELLQGFRVARARLLQILERVDLEVLERTALHPRLRRPMRLIDHAFFAAEHDDHHLATITELVGSGEK